ncbi:bile salt-activated lipase-like, partial [Notothenia coriiceps]|uniref:Bile salt-activated lipase-like n=1 Tax=Notothenia coriiceps TaxID=8208 RepID=A0A6I9MSC9_9TELE
EEVETLLAAFTKDKSDAGLQAALSLYNSTWEPTPSQESIKKTLVDIETDFLFLASTQAALHRHADNAKTGRTYSYLFNEPNQRTGIIKPLASWMGANHMDDVPYVFGKPFTAPSLYSASQRDLSGYMIAYWTNFARTG